MQLSKSQNASPVFAHLPTNLVCYFFQIPLHDIERHMNNGGIQDMHLI
jgi:hypothetical protein